MLRVPTLLSAAQATLQTIEQGWASAQEQPGTLEDRRKMRTANVHAVTTAIDVIDQMFRLMGGSSVYETSCLQRHFRDVRGRSPHDGGQTCNGLAGRVMLGLDEQALGREHPGIYFHCSNALRSRFVPGTKIWTRNTEQSGNSIGPNASKR